MLLVWSVNCRGSIKPQHHWHWALLHRLQFLAKVGSATLKNPSISLWFASFTAQNCAMAPALQSDGVTNRSFFQCMTLLLASGIGSGVLVFLGWSSAEPSPGQRLSCNTHLIRIPRAMASVGYMPAALFFFIGALVSGVTTWILSLAVLHETHAKLGQVFSWCQLVVGFLEGWSTNKHMHGLLYIEVDIGGMLTCLKTWKHWVQAAFPQWVTTGRFSCFKSFCTFCMKQNSLPFTHILYILIKSPTATFYRLVAEALP